MTNPVTDFIDKAKGLTRNPLGIIALFVSLIYGFACLVLSTSINNLHGPCERLPLIWFVIIFPILILIVFKYLVVKHHKKLYGPSDFKDEKNFVSNFSSSKEIRNLLEKFEITDNEKMDKQLSETLEQIKQKSESIPINNLWRLNHWGSKYASINKGKMIFCGNSEIKNDGSHINLQNILEIGKIYEISCFAKADSNTNGQFQLWCHDNIEDGSPNGFSDATTYRTPSINGEIFKILFKPQFNSNIRIHLQYMSGDGKIEISNVRISEYKK